MTHRLLDRPEVLVVLFYPRREEEWDLFPPGVCLVAGIHLQSLSPIGQLKSLLRSHIPKKGELSICNHRQDGGGTESSHIIYIQGEGITWSSLVGFPCENDYHCVQLFPG